MERLRMIKCYRTPQALRSYGRIFSILLPPFFSPVYANMIVSMDAYGIGIAYAVITAVALSGLYECVYQFEDPFVPTSFLDGVHVKAELIKTFQPQAAVLRSHYFPNATPREPNGRTNCVSEHFTATPRIWNTQ